MFQPISGTTKTFCLIACPASASSSPALHNASFEAQGLDARFLAYDVEPHELKDAVFGMKALGITGYSVGVPHKQAIIAYLDELSDAARLMQSVNCVVQSENGSLVGHNTDGVGFTESLKEADVGLEGSKLAIIDDGAEGPSWIVQAALDGAAEILVLVPECRLEQERAWLASLQNQLATEFKLKNLEALGDDPDSLVGFDALCNGSRIGVAATLGRLPVPEELLGLFPVVVDANYNPRETALLGAAKKLGCITVEGLEPLLNQAAHAQRMWLGCDLPKEEVKQAIFA